MTNYVKSKQRWSTWCPICFTKVFWSGSFKHKCKTEKANTNDISSR